MSRTFQIVIACMAILAPTPEVAAEVGRAGPEIRVNSNLGSTFEEEADVLALANGSYVVTWEETGTSSGLGSASVIDVWGQVIDSDSAHSGNAFLVNTSTNGTQRGASGTGLSNGDFVVSWYSFDAAVESYSKVRAQRFDSSGAKLGSEIAVSDDTGQGAGLPAATSYTDGFLLVWSSADGIRARRYANDGTAGTTFFVHSSSGRAVHVSANESGAFVVVWASTDEDIYARRFAADDQPEGAAFVVNTKTEDFQAEPTVALANDGSFFVAWWDGWFVSIDGDDATVCGRVFDAEGVALAPQFVINTHTAGREVGPRIVVDSAGVYSIAWWEWSSAFDRNGQAVVFRQYDPLGEPIGDVLPVNRIILADQVFPDIAIQPNGNALVAWQSEDEDPGNFNDSFPQRIRAQRMCDPANPGCDRCSGFDDSVDVDEDDEPDGCDLCVRLLEEQAASRSKLRYDRGDDAKPPKLVASMQFAIDGDFSELDPSIRGARISIVDSLGHTLFDETLPPGTYDPDTRVGWALQAHGRRWKFFDGSAPASERHARMSITHDLSDGPGQVSIKVRKTNEVLPSMDPEVHLPQLIVALGDQQDASNGLCGERAFPAESCELSYRVVSCR
jgi:hypothetical protein